VLDVFWPLGWSLIFESVVGLSLVPVWLVMIWIGTGVEEEAHVHEYGDKLSPVPGERPRPDSASSQALMDAVVCYVGNELAADARRF
jgi:hypothetical protein